jgi:hypothetical protein
VCQETSTDGRASHQAQNISWRRNWPARPAPEFEPGLTATRRQQILERIEKIEAELAELRELVERLEDGT